MNLDQPSAEARAEWLASYVSTFLERDLPALGLHLASQKLHVLWKMLTHVHGNLVNESDLARSLGVSVPTVHGYLDVLESTFMLPIEIKLGSVVAAIARGEVDLGLR